MGRQHALDQRRGIRAVEDVELAGVLFKHLREAKPFDGPSSIRWWVERDVGRMQVVCSGFDVKDALRLQRSWIRGSQSEIDVEEVLGFGCELHGDVTAKAAGSIPC